MHRPDICSLSPPAPFGLRYLSPVFEYQWLTPRYYIVGKIDFRADSPIELKQRGSGGLPDSQAVKRLPDLNVALGH